jgi:hypothetical protein
MFAILFAHALIPCAQCMPLFDSRAFVEAKGSRRFGGNASLRTALLRPISGPTFAIPSMSAADKQPLFLLAPGDRSWATGAGLSWKSRLACLGKVVVCGEDALGQDTPAMVRLLLKRIADSRAKGSLRPLIIVGLSVGCKVAVLAALREEGVAAIVCLGPHVQGCPAAVLEYGP